jgi:hypothetical protein
MSVKGYLALLVGVFVVALAVVGASQRAGGRGRAGAPGGPAADRDDQRRGRDRRRRRLEGLVRRADTGPYAAKEGGRDQVVAGPAAGSRSFTPEGQDAARYR